MISSTREILKSVETEAKLRKSQLRSSTDKVEEAEEAESQSKNLNENNPLLSVLPSENSPEFKGQILKLTEGNRQNIQNRIEHILDNFNLDWIKKAMQDGKEAYIAPVNTSGGMASVVEFPTQGYSFDAGALNYLFRRVSAKVRKPTVNENKFEALDNIFNISGHCRTDSLKYLILSKLAKVDAANDKDAEAFVNYFRAAFEDKKFVMTELSTKKVTI